MNPLRLQAGLLIIAVLAANRAEASRPILLHPDNPHYFLFRDKPTILITSGEHYGAVLNRNFDYVPYLNELQARGLNLTRTFAGTYREVPGSFGITDNTLAPETKNFLCPWPRTETAGALDGGTKFDLEKFDSAYFERLRDFVGQASKRGIVVELSLFCAIYDDKLWNVNPMKADNNVQSIGKGGRLEVFTLKDAKLQAVQEALVRKIVAELKDCDNLYYEICNEPYFGGVTKEWNDRLAAIIAEAEKELPHRHLIAQNISNGSAKVDKPNPHVSILNFHYATPPDAVAQNYALKRPIADDETGFRGKDDRVYRHEAWEFLLAGGAIFDHLDYSFTSKHPGGTAAITTSPGGGGPAFRRQMQVLKQFMDSFDFVHMKPDNTVLKGGSITAPLEGHEARATVRALVELGKAYALYVRGGTQAELRLELPAGKYAVEWLDPKTGKTEKEETIDHAGGVRPLTSPAYQEDIALRVKRVKRD
jgi:hypothetical protein